jgi:molybdopterin synthase sulfur carrier subunit
VQIEFVLAGPLRPYAGGASSVAVELTEGACVTDALDALAKAYPAVERRVRDDEGRVRRHVNVFVGSDPVGQDDAALRARLRPGERLVVLPAVSGGR